jgi:predicted PolB exonuclease-like 3'-5' exonuclease
VLALRALRHALPAGWYSNDHRKRYTEVHHLDLFDALSESDSSRRAGFSLDTFCRIIGLPGKLGFDGSMVRAAFDKGEIAKIEGYCLVDVMRTTFLLIRYLMMRGRISREMFETATRALWDQCQQRQMTGVLFGADMNMLMGLGPTVETPAA